MSAGTLVSGLVFISLANYRAPLQGWRLLPPSSASRLYLRPPQGPAMC